MRASLRQVFANALSGSSIEQAFRRHLSCEHGVLRICEDLYDLDSFACRFVVAIGKAAHSLVDALRNHAGERFEGLVTSSVLPATQAPGFRYFCGGHPLPNRESVAAAESLLRSLARQGPESLVIFLVSGGGSSMLEKAVEGEVSLPDLVGAYQLMLDSGASIAPMNAIRKHLSAVKGGRLALCAYPARQVSILVSDVPDDHPDALASGPTMPDPTTVEDCYAIAREYGCQDRFPESVRQLFDRRALQETPKPGDPCFERSRWSTVLSNASLVENSRRQAEALGFKVEIDHGCDDWDYARASEYLLARLTEGRKHGERVCLISGGEVTVKLTGAGVGGRNQQFALACALKIGGEPIAILSAGSDGIDGNSPAAGAVVDGTTLERARRLGLSAAAYLEAFDAYNFFASLGDAIVIGPTGNNLRDLRILLAY
jgi:hydroxypyruvate reductase